MSIPNYTLGIGLRPYILPHLRNIIGEGALPQTKIEHVGFLNLLQSQDKPKLLRLNNAAGHKESVQIKYLQRLTEAYSGTNEADVCSSAIIDPYKEATADLSSFRFVALHLDDETVAQYENDASAMVSAGSPPTQLMKEMLERIMSGANAVLTGVRTDLLTSLVAGTNRVTGLSTAKTLNFPLNSTNNDLTASINGILSDFSVNLLSSNPIILANAGSLMHQFLLQQYAKSANQAGINTAVEAAGVTGFVDAGVGSIFGAQNFLAIERNSVQIVEYLQFTGFKAGAKPGGSVFGTIPLPMQVGRDVKLIEFDYQLKYNDCATTITDSYYGTPLTMQKGYTLILSKKCGLFQIPADAYRGIDANLGVNGVLRYNATNV